MNPLKALPVLLCFCGTALAQVDPVDVILKVENGRVQTGAVENSVTVYPRHVYRGVLGDTGTPGATFNPGYDSENGAFGASQLVGLTFRKALRRWNGSDFSAIPPEQVNIIKNSTITTPAQDPSGCGVGDSLTLGVANSVGHVHIHPAYQLTGAASTGTYAVELQFWMTDPATGVSPPFWVLLNQNVSQQAFDDAFNWAAAHLAGPVDCYANCDGSSAAPALNVNDFICFSNRFAAGDCYANCDGSTSSPALNVNDFICFSNRFAAGCP